MQIPNEDICTEPPRRKLGLALSGGGFRASLFHLGVFHRLAELDLLRYVEVLSTVSGGSIIGALYILLLKKNIDRYGTLKQEQYVQLIDDLDRILVRGIKKNLRARLFMNPLGMLRVLVTHDSLGRRMARIYERYIYKEAVEQLKGTKSWWQSFWRPGRFLLKDLEVHPGGKIVKEGFESYNRQAVEKHGSVITHLILNATSLNSGAPFNFSSIEIGDPRLGFFRYKEIEKIWDRKRVLDEGNSATTHSKLAKETISLIDWWKAFRETNGSTPAPPDWSKLFAISDFPGGLKSTNDFGRLRAMKLCAWYVRVGAKKSPPICGGFTNDKHIEHFWEILSQIDDNLASRCQKEYLKNPSIIDSLLDFVLEFYYIRSAEVASDNIQDNYDNLRVGEAVGASACFPPVFPPFIVMGIYDDLHVARLGLTDGGAYDNVGITALLEERCNYIIASDTSGLFEIQKSSTTNSLIMSVRIVSILMNIVASIQQSGVRDKRKVTQKIDESKYASSSKPLLELKENYGLDGLAFFHINSPPIGISTLNLHLDRKLLSAMRTDLDGFGDIEVAALVNHGYDTADLYVRQYFAESPYA